MSSVRREIVIRPGNPNDFTEEALDELAREIQDAVSAAEVRVDLRPQRGYGVTWYEVVDLYDMAAEVAGHVGLWVGVGGAAATVTNWARRRWQRKKDENPSRNPRPIWVTMYGPDGLPIKEVRVEPDGELVEEDANDTRPPPEA